MACDYDVESEHGSETSVSAVHNETASWVESAEELERMRRHIESLYGRDDVIHTFRAVSGDIVDCVSLQAQPAMRAPDMEGHVIMSAPTTVPREIGDTAERDERQSDLALAEMFELEGVDGDGSQRSCPDHTVPVRRPDLSALARFRTLDDVHNKYPRGKQGSTFARAAGDADPTSNASKPEEEAPKQGAGNYHQYAHALQYVSNRGAQSTINVWNPYVQQDDEFSLSQVWVLRGVGDSLETVEAGWQSYKNKYGDSNSRFFIHFTPDNYDPDRSGCYNLDCASFVQTNKSVLIGGKFDKYSVKDGYQKEITVMWYKDGDAGHWWLRLDGSWVGYYPRSKFDSAGLRDKASGVDFGGEITDDQAYGIHTPTDMGSGAFAYHGFRKAAYHRNTRYIDTSLTYHDATLSPDMTDASCYDILLYKSPTWGQYFYFGGAGYSAACE